LCGTSIALWHFWQRTFLPAISSCRRKTDWHFAQVTEIGIADSPRKAGIDPMGTVYPIGAARDQKKWGKKRRAGSSSRRGNRRAHTGKVGVARMPQALPTL